MIEKQESDRRGFCLAVIYGLSALMSAALALPAAVYLFLPPRKRKDPEWVEAGDLSQIDPHQPLEVVFRRTRTDGWKVASEKATAWVVNTGDRVIAFSPWCTHLGCAYHWDQQKRTFLCPCHASAFDINGKVLAGPAPRPLDRYEVKVEGNRVWLGPVRKSGEASA